MGNEILMTGPVTDRGAFSRILEVVSNTHDGVYAVDETHSIILWNAGAHRILGHSAEDVLGRACYDVIAGRDAEGNVVCRGGCADMALARTGKLISSRDMVVQTMRGGDIWVNMTNVPVPSEFGGLFTAR